MFISSEILIMKFSFDYLIKIAGDRTVPIELGSRYSDDDWTQKLMTISDFVKQYCQQQRVKIFLIKNICNESMGFLF